MGWTGIFHILFYKRGAIILVHRLLPFTARNSYKDTDGRIVLVKGELYGESVLLGNVYAPNVYDQDFLPSYSVKLLKWTAQI